MTEQFSITPTTFTVVMRGYDREQVDAQISDRLIAVVDGKYGFGQTVTPQAIRIGIDKCKKNGLSAVTLRNAALDLP